jgi:hypothetical protein
METSVEWLVDKVFGKNGLILYAEVIEHAKAMHKEEIIEAFKHGELPPLFVNLNAEEYYNETFNNGTHIN